MPWSYDPSRPASERFQWSDDGTPADPVSPVWPGEPRHAPRVADPAAETARVAAEFTAAMAGLIRQALAELDRLDRGQQ